MQHAKRQDTAGGGSATADERPSEQAGPASEAVGGSPVAAQAGEGSGLPEMVGATLGRVLHIYYPERWSGPRACRVCRELTSSKKVNVNVDYDGTTDEHQLHIARQARYGNTIELVPVYPPLSADDRAKLAAAIKQGGDIRPYWAEFPPRV